MLVEGVLNPNLVERGGSEERPNTEDRGAIDLLRTSSGSASLDRGTRGAGRRCLSPMSVHERSEVERGGSEERPKTRGQGRY